MDLFWIGLDWLIYEATIYIVVIGLNFKFKSINRPDFGVNQQ